MATRPIRPLDLSFLLNESRDSPQLPADCRPQEMPMTEPRTVLPIHRFDEKLLAQYGANGEHPLPTLDAALRGQLLTEHRQLATPSITRCA